MDDLDHSLNIADNDWSSFYEDSEECGLLQPSLACSDSLSDSEDLANASLKFDIGQQKQEQSSNEAESSAAGCCTEEEMCAKYTTVQIIPCGLDDLVPKDEICLDHPEGTTEIHDTVTPQTEQLSVQSLDGDSTERKPEDGDALMRTDIHKLKPLQEPDPLSCNRTEINVNEPHAAERAAVSEDMSGVASKAEKERWFVTVNDSPARQRVQAVKKKRRQKKVRKANHMCRPDQEKSVENGSKLGLDKDNIESEGEADTECVTKKKQNLVEKSAGCPSVEEDLESVHMGLTSDSSQLSLTSVEEDILSEKVVMTHFPKEKVVKPMLDRNKPEPSASASTARNRFKLKEPSRLDSVESDEFFSSHSFDSESYLSASESFENLQQLLVEQQQLQSSLSLTENSSLFHLTDDTDADHTQDGEVDSCDGTGTAPDSEGHESIDAHHTLTFPSADQSADKMPDDNSTCDNNKSSTQHSDTPEHEVHLSASGCSSGDQLPPVPDLTVTPCSVADSPETYAEAAGHTRPVYAISAFWDEMEKLTINDILQLRMGSSTPSQETAEAVTPSIDDRSSLGDTVEYNSSDGGLMDASDAADSDYFTQPDDSKPDRSSCDFSTSDFEEEYWQFLGTSRNPSPDPQSKKHQNDSSFSVRDEDESTGSEGRETPVPSEEFAMKCFEDKKANALISSELVWPRQITKTKSVHNVQALNTEDLSLQLLLGNDDSSVFLSSGLALEENVILKANDSLGTPTPFLDEHYRISFPEVFEYFFREDKTKSDFRCVDIYDPDVLSVAPGFDFTLCSFTDDLLFSSLLHYQCIEEKPIPIFSCSHPTVRELTFPNPSCVFLSADCKQEEDDISPIRVVSCSGFGSWKSLIRKICFPDKGSIWCRTSGAWVFPVEAEKFAIKSRDPPTTVLTERRVSFAPSQLFSELTVQQKALEAIQTTRQDSLFSTLKQSDMCLVCIAFASWVLKSSDPEAADTWKAVLLANVSALSAIQYLRHYVKKTNPS